MSEIVSTNERRPEMPEGYLDANNTALAVNLARVEIDHQIATARAYPRQLTHVKNNITTLATLDEETAKECIYALPRGGKPIKGPSIRFAEILSSQWGNCRVAARVVEVNRFEKYVEAEGIFHDLESNTATTARTRRRIVDRHGRLYDDDMILVTSNAAGAIAKRNAIIAGVPKAVWRAAYAAVEQVLAGDIKTLAERKALAFKAFAAFGVKPEQIFEALNIGGADDIGLDDMITLTAMHASLKSGEASVEEMFKPKAEPTKGGATLGERLDKIAGVKPTEQVDAKTGEVTDKPKPESDKAPAETKNPETVTSEESAAAPRPRGRPRKAQEGQEGAEGATGAPNPEKAAQAAPSPAPAAKEGEQDPPFDTEESQGAQEEEENPVFAAGREAAEKGSVALKKWKNRLSVKEFASVSGEIAGLEKFARDMDAANKGE